tara:strand:- start:8 stop:670 length:663 start_codon:yes stop_codon:yes gene_type:complete
MDIKIQILIVVVILVIIGGFLYFTEIKKCDGKYDILSLTCNQSTSKPTKTPTPKKPSPSPTPKKPSPSPSQPTEEQLIVKYGLKGEITQKMKDVLEKVKKDASDHMCKYKIQNINTKDDFDYNTMWDVGTENDYEKLNYKQSSMGSLNHYLKKGMRFDENGKLHTRSRFNEEVNHNPYCSKKGYDGKTYRYADELADAADPICPKPCTVGLPKELKDKII